MEQAVQENHSRFEQRIAFLSGFGYDPVKEREALLEALGPLEGSVLELGAGKGYFCLTLARRGYRFISVDISEPELKICRLNLRYYGLEHLVDLRREDVAHLSFSAAAFDNIVSVNLFHHLSDPRGALTEMCRVVTPGGKIIISDFNQRGVLLINQCHQAEGRWHEHTGNDLKFARDFFRNKNFCLKGYDTDLHSVLIAVRGVEE